MGIRDQSWCSSCGAGMLYTEDENATCYRCDQEEYNKLETRSSKFMEYMKIHLISLEQDAEMLQDKMDSFTDDLDSDEYRDLEMEDVINTGEMKATQHLLSVAEGMIK